MGSSSGSSGSNYLVQNDLIDMSWDYMYNRRHLSGHVYVYSSRMGSALLLTKHHGIIVDIPEQTHFWALERMNNGLEKSRGKTTNGTKQDYLGYYSVAKIYDAANGACSGRNYNVASNNCNHWVERFVTGLGYSNVKVGTFSSIN